MARRQELQCSCNRQVPPLLAPRSKLRDLEASDLESKKTMPRLLVYYAPLKD